MLSAAELSPTMFEFSVCCVTQSVESICVFCRNHCLSCSCASLLLVFNLVTTPWSRVITSSFICLLGTKNTLLSSRRPSRLVVVVGSTTVQLAQLAVADRSCSLVRPSLHLARVTRLLSTNHGLRTTLESVLKLITSVRN